MDIYSFLDKRKICQHFDLKNCKSLTTKGTPHKNISLESLESKIYFLTIGPSVGIVIIHLKFRNHFTNGKFLHMA